MLFMLCCTQVIPFFIGTPRANANTLNNHQGVGCSVTLIKDGIVSQIKTSYAYTHLSDVSRYLQVFGGTKYNVTGFPEYWSFDHISPSPNTMNVDSNSWINFTGHSNVKYTVYWTANEICQLIGWKDDSFIDGWLPVATHSSVSTSFSSDGDIVNITLSRSDSKEAFIYYKKRIPFFNFGPPESLIFRSRGTQGAEWFIILEDRYQNFIWGCSAGAWQNFTPEMSTRSYDISSIAKNITYISIGTRSANGSTQSGYWDYIMFCPPSPQPSKPFAIHTPGNGGFETGDSREWILENGPSGAIVSDTVYSGKYALELGVDKLVGKGPQVKVSRTNDTNAEYEKTSFFACASASSIYTFSLNLTGYSNYKVTEYPSHWSFEKLIVNDVEDSPDDECDVNYAIIKTGVYSNDTIHIVWRGNEIYQPAGWKDDSFQTGWEIMSGTPVSYVTDGDIITWTVPAGQSNAYIERGELNISLEDYPFALIRYKHRNGSMTFTIGSFGVVEPISYTHLPPADNFTTYVLDLSSLQQKDFNRIWIHKYGENTTAYVDFIMFCSSKMLPRYSSYVHPVFSKLEGRFSIYGISGQGELAISAKEKNLLYIFSSSTSPIQVEDDNSKIVFTVITKDRWTPVYINFAQDWLDKFETSLPTSLNLTISVRGAGKVCFDEFDFWSWPLTVTVYNARSQPMGGVAVGLFDLNDTRLDSSLTGSEGNTLFYPFPQGNYTLKVKYKHITCQKPVHIYNMSSFYVVYLPIYLEIFGIPLTKSQTIALFTIGVVACLLALSYVCTPIFRRIFKFIRSNETKIICSPWFSVIISNCYNALTSMQLMKA